MPSIPLDPTRWVRVTHPESQFSTGTVVIKSLGGACFFSTDLVAPPEETSENTFSPTATEVTEGSESTVTVPKWFKAKKQDSKTPLKPVALEVKAQPEAAFPGGNIIANSITGTQTAADLSGLRLIHNHAFVIKAGETLSGIEEQYILTGNGVTPTQIKCAAKVAKFGEVVPNQLLWTPTNYAIAGKTTQATLIVDLLTGIAPASNITFGMYPISAIAETEAQTELTYGSVIAASKVLFTAPAGKSGLTGSSGSFTTLVTNTNYSMGFNLSATTALKSMVVGQCKLYVSNA